MTASVFANLKSGSNLQLLQHLILMNKDERNLLKVLAELGDVERVNKLIDFGADVNASSTLDGSTALIGAARGNCAEVLSILLNNGANVTHVDMFGLTALDWAEACGCEETAALLRLASGCPLWSTSMVTELLKGITSSADNSKSDTVERGGTWLGSLLTQRGVSSDHIAWCEDVLIEQEGFCTSEVFASVPESILSRAYLSSVGICALGVQQVLLQLHAELQRGLSESTSWSSYSSYTVSESTDEAHSSDTTTCLEEVQSSSDDGAESETSASSNNTTSSSCSENDSEDDSGSVGNDSNSNSNNDDSTNSDSGDPSSPTSFYKTYCASAQYSNTSDTSDTSNSGDNGGSTGLADRCATRTSVNDCVSMNSVTSTQATTIPQPTTVSSTSTASTTPSTKSTNNKATGSGTDDPVTSARCTCMCFFCPAGRQVALRTVHTILAKYHVVILLCLASASVGLVVGYNCTAQGMLIMILLLWFFLMVMAAVAAVAADAYERETD